MIQCNRLFRVSLFFFSSIGILACDGPATQPTTVSTNRYFSLEDFFLDEIERLTRSATIVDKTVSRNGVSEQKHIQIEDWKSELALFMDSDINKPAWQNSYRIDSTEYSLTYTSTDPELRTQRITINKNKNGLIKHIAIKNHTNNMLYQTAEQLDYYPDSVYLITKQQQVRFIGDNEYVIQGRLP